MLLNANIILFTEGINLKLEAANRANNGSILSKFTLSNVAEMTTIQNVKTIEASTYILGMLLVVSKFTFIFFILNKYFSNSFIQCASLPYNFISFKPSKLS